MTRTSTPAASRRARETPPPDEASRVKREGNTATLIYEELRAKILDGTFAPGEPISQLSVAKAGGTSRGPVREALRRLEQEKLVVAEANRRFCVAAFDIGDLEEVLGLHLVNISLAIRIGTPFLTKDDLKQLSECAEEFDKAANRDRFAWDATFRRYVLCFAQHAGTHTVSLINGLIDDAQRYRTHVLADLPPVSHPPGKPFREITRAATAKEGQRAAELFADLFSRIASLVVASASPRYDAARLRAYIAAVLPDTP
jgi:DNA-binding GntR family transcriptional regulator